MASRAAVAVVVVCLVAAPGCNALGGSDAEAVETLTPVPVTADGSTPTSTPARQSGSLPPGVSPNGTVDVDRLVAAHESVLADRTYRWEFSLTVTGRAGPFNPNSTRVVVVGNEEVLVEQKSPGVSANQSVFLADGTGYLRSSGSQGVRYDTFRSSNDHYSVAFSGTVLERFLTNLTVDVTTVEANGQTYYRLYAADGEVPPQLQQEAATVREYTVTAYVTPDGFVRTVAVEYERVERRDGHVVTARYDYTDLNDVTVERPDWMSRFRPNDASSEDNRTVTPTDGSPPGNGTDDCTGPDCQRSTASTTQTASGATLTRHPGP